MSDQFIFYENNKDEFKMWQGLKGPYYTPYVDENGNLSWTNNGELPNPATVNIRGTPGTGLEIKGIVESISDLPSSTGPGDVYLVGSEPPYDGYVFIENSWTYIGVVGVGENGRGIVSITKTSTVGLVDTYTITYTDGVNPTTFTVTNGQDGSPGVGVPAGGTTGQILAKASGTDFNTEWVDQSAGVDPATSTPIMDGTGAVGTSAKYAREDHVHPTDTSRASQSDMVAAQAALSNVVLEAAEQTILATDSNITSSWITQTGLTADHVVGNWGLRNSDGAIPVNAPPCDITIETGSGQWRYTLGTNSSAFFIKPTFVLKQN